MAHPWPVRLEERLDDGATLVLRGLRRRDQHEWLELRRRSWDWLEQWEPTPARPGQVALPYPAYLRHQRREARAGRLLPFVAEVEGRLCGAVTLSQVFEGALWGASAGYWCAPTHAGRGIAPLALAMACDYAVRERGLHRIEVNIRPENHRSLAVAAKLSFRAEGLRERYLHIDGAWRDHHSFALTTEELGGSTFVQRLRSGDRAQGRTGGSHDKESTRPFG
ncbi:GNAT family N-acetyltransferase [Arsenicicoccus dermatophilus]|uniref:GNAT family N-acetyltransferase n=1 Tax=Arsenicicoccus dermatophilus TaxID=1076331 RepID=UPI001F4C6F7B|nr:GNAT family protein [Arsenicicoccus dermatophilus]MCH8612092.1 GNAT family N-acetyltransferase [Arsenicicoccus dermatophilus]